MVHQAAQPPPASDLERSKDALPPFAGARNPLRHGILMFGIPTSARLSYFQRLLLSMPPAIMQVLYTVA